MAGVAAKKEILGLAKQEYDESGVHSRLELIEKRRKGKISLIRDEDHGLYGERVSWETKRLFWHRKHSITVTVNGNDPEQQLTVRGRYERRVGRFAEGSSRQEMTRALRRAERSSQSENARPLPEQKKRHHRHIFWGVQMPLASLGIFSAAAVGLSMLRLGLYGEPWIFPHTPAGDIQLFPVPFHLTKFAFGEFTPSDIRLHLPVAAEPVIESGSALASYFALRRIDAHLKNYNRRIEKRKIAY